MKIKIADLVIKKKKKSTEPKEGEKNKENGTIYSAELHMWLPQSAYTAYIDLRREQNLMQMRERFQQRSDYAAQGLMKDYLIGMGYTTLASFQLAEIAWFLEAYNEKNPLSDMEYKRLQRLVGEDAEEMNSFFKSGGEKVPDKQVLERYKELIMRMLDKSKGAYQRVAPKAYKVQVDRLNMINDALKKIP